MTDSQQQFPNSSQLHHFIDAGFELIKLHQHNAIGKSGQKVGKIPVGRWRDLPPLTSEEAEAWMAEGGNIGIRLGPNHFVADIDPRNYVGSVDSLQDFRVAYPELDDAFDYSAPSVLTGSRTDDDEPGIHFFLAFEPPEDWEVGDKLRNGLPQFPGVEFKTAGTQVLAIGCLHPDTGLEYVWNIGEQDPMYDFGKMPVVPDRLVEALRRRPAPKGVLVDGADWTGDMLAEFLAKLDPTEFRDYDNWIGLLAACHAGTQGEGVYEFVAWCYRDELFAHCDDQAYKWDTFDANLVGGKTVKTLEYIAQQKGIDIPRRPAADFGDTLDEDTKMEDAPTSAKTNASWLERINNEYCFVDEGGSIVIYRDKYDEELENDYWAKYKVVEFKQKFDDKEVETPFSSRHKSMPLGSAWLKWSGRYQADGIAFKPEAKPGILPSGALNLWKGFGVEPNPQGDCSALYELIDEALAEDEVSAKYILDWMAYSVQFPHLPAQVAVVFRGGKGTGKGTLGRAFFQLFGRHGKHITSPTLLTGRFNDHLRDCVALFADEAFWAGDKQGESVLKGLVTEPKIMYEGKGTNAVMGRNCIHVMMASNSDWVVPAGVEDERRFAVFQVSDQYRNNKAFFTKLHQQLTNGGLGRLLHDLQERDISDFDPIADTPQTKALGDQKLAGISTTHEHAFIHAVLNGSFEDYVTTLKPETEELVITKADFKGLMKQASKGHRYLKHSDADQTVSQFFIRLQSITGCRIKQQRGYKGLGDDRPWVWILPPLDTCREMVADLLSYTLSELPIDGSVTDWRQSHDNEA